MSGLPEGYTPLDSIPLPEINQSEFEKARYCILSEVNQPTVWRFIEKEYVDNFFETGEIMLSTYVHCAGLEDEIRKDTEEGKVTLESTKGTLRSEMKIGVGSNAFILCSSLSQNNEYSNGKVYDACIEISDILAFIRTITLKLIQQINVIGVVHGACMYNNCKW